MLGYKGVVEAGDTVALTALIAIFAFLWKGEALPSLEANYEIAAICLANNINNVALILCLRGGTGANPDSGTVTNASTNP